MSLGAIDVTIERFDREKDTQPRRESYTVPKEEGMVVADVLQYLYERETPDLGFLWECRTRRCGTCAVRLGERPVLACREPVQDQMFLRPLERLPVVRDLIVDRLALEERIAPWLDEGKWEPKPSRILLEPGEIAHYRALSECIDCFICDSVCPALEQNQYGGQQFGGPRRLIRMEAKIQREAESQPWLMYAAEYNPSLCTRCFACTEACPRDLRPAEAIGSLTGRLYEEKLLDSHKTAHVGTFMRSIRTGGWLDEFRLMIDVYGIFGVLKLSLQALRMLIRGKLPKPQLRQNEQGKEIKQILQQMESAELPQVHFTWMPDEKGPATLKDSNKENHEPQSEG